MVRARAIVSGVVQGVGFRFFASQMASRYKIKGFARNLPNGTVEIEAEADRSTVTAYLKEIRVGPRYGHVADIQVAWLEPKQYTAFSIY
jgi:acylphosphatase